MKSLLLLSALFFSHLLIAQTNEVFFDKEWRRGEEKSFRLEIHMAQSKSGANVLDTTVVEPISLKVLDTEGDDITVSLRRDNPVTRGVGQLSGTLPSGWKPFEKISFDGKVNKESGVFTLLNPLQCDSLYALSRAKAEALLGERTDSASRAFLVALSEEKGPFSDNLSENGAEVLLMLRLLLHKRFVPGDTVEVTDGSVNPLQLENFPGLTRKMYLARSGKGSNPSEVVSTARFNMQSYMAMLTEMGQAAGNLLGQATAIGGEEKSAVESISNQMSGMLTALLKQSGLEISESIRVSQSQTSAWPLNIERDVKIDLPGMGQAISIQARIFPE